MRYQKDHDLHLHSQLSLCSGDPNQNPQRILQYAKDSGYKAICLTDHFWDESVEGASSWYQKQDYAHIKQALPLPQEDGIVFRFGCETDMDKFCTVGVGEKVYGELDFVIIPTTHLHMTGFTIDEEDDSPKNRRKVYVDRLKALLKKDIPFGKTGIAHLTTSLIDKRDDNHIRIIDSISDEVFGDIFSTAKKKGVGIELNLNPLDYSADDREKILRPYRIAKECGCLFYLGTDAHHPDAFEIAAIRFDSIIDCLNLKEEHKFKPFDF